METQTSSTLSFESFKEIHWHHICLYSATTNVNRSNKRKRFKIKKMTRRYPTETMTDADYADDLALLANTPV